MNIEMSYLLPAFATVLAPMAQGQSTPPQPKITAVLTILSPKPGVTPERVMKIMPAEIRATVGDKRSSPGTIATAVLQRDKGTRS